MGYLHLQIKNGELKFFRTWRALTAFMFDNYCDEFFIAEEGGDIIVKVYRDTTGKRHVDYLIEDQKKIPSMDFLAVIIK